MTTLLADVQEGLEKSHSHSRRKGKWSTVPDVKKFEDKARLTNLRKLVKQGSAVEKKVKTVPVKLFKPTRAGGGGEIDDITGIPRYAGPTPDEGPRDGGDQYPDPFGPPRDGKPDQDGKSPDDYWDDQPRRGSPTGDVVGAGIGTLLVGGLGGSTGLGGRVPGPSVV